MDRKIHIAVPIRYPVGGIRTYLKYTYGKLPPEGYCFTIIGTSQLWLDRIRKDLASHNLDIVCLDNEVSTASFFRVIVRTFFSAKPDIIHSQGFTAGLMSAIVNSLFRLPHVITLHRIFGHDHFSGKFWGKNASLKKELMTFLLKRADVIQSVSHDAQANLLAYLPGLSRTPEKLKVIRNGIDTSLFTEPKNLEIDAFRRKPGLFYIGFFGRYMPEKGFPHLIDAMDILVNQHNVRNIRIISVGGFGGFIREYQKEIIRRELEPYFQFLDFFENIAPILKNIGLLAIPSLSEACGLIAMEGLACGAPIVAYSCPGLREVLSGTPSKMVTTGDREGLADAIIKIMDNYASIKSEFEAFIPEARQRFDVAQTARKLDQVFQNLHLSKSQITVKSQ